MAKPAHMGAAYMAQLAQRLLDAAAAEDWLALTTIDREVVVLLSRLSAPTADVLTAAERSALQALKQTHQQARDNCAIANEQLARRMGALQANKDGWLAYALNSDVNEIQP